MPKRRPEVREAILRYVEQVSTEHGYAPSVREIAQAVGLRSPASVAYHLRRLEEEGRLARRPTAARSIALAARAPATTIPVLAEVGAGYHVVPDANVHETIAIPRELGEDGAFALRVRGTSMVDAGILEGDLVVVRPSRVAEDGEIVVASVGTDVGTVKVLRRREGRAWLEAANRADPSLAPIAVTEEVRIHGRVVGLLRTYGTTRVGRGQSS